MTSTNIDYINKYFQFPELTQIHNEPTYESLQVIKDQLKTNAATVISSLGGGAHGHLGAVLTREEYARLSAVQYMEPAFPVLDLPNPVTGPVISQLNRQFSEDLRVYREVADIKKALVKQIVAAVDPTYLKTLRNDDSHSITHSIPEILAYLFRRYGRVTPDKLNKKELEVRSFVYSLQEPLVTLFDQVEDLRKLGDAAQMPYTAPQILNFGIQLIRNTHDFQDALKSWFSKSNADKNWTNFKLHFEDEHDKLQLVRGATMENAGFHQANFIASQVREEVHNVQTNVLELLQRHHADKENEEPPELVNQQANAAKNTDPALSMQMEMLKLIKSLQQEVSGLKAQNNNQNNYQNNPNNYQNNPNNGNYKGNNPNNYQGRRFTNKYCWSHGACGHDGKVCRFKKENHKDDATFKNRMNGSNHYCNETNK